MVDSDPFFSERDFYLTEFRGRHIGIVLPATGADPFAHLGRTLEALADNGTGVVLFASSRAPWISRAAGTVRPDLEPAWAGRVWRNIAKRGHAVVELSEDDWETQSAAAAIQLGLMKAVWIRESGAMLDPAGQRISVVALDSTALAEMGQTDRAAQNLPLATIRRMLVGGIASVSVCRLDDLDAELFSYAGAGTFFSRERYTDVRSLTLEDFDLAASLLKQGEAEGYLAVRDADAIEQLLGHGFGVFVEGRYLAGFCALLPYADSAIGEIAGLYTVTRFAGEGVGGQLIRHALEAASQSGLHGVFACTTSERVEGFFLRNGFARMKRTEVPVSKWDLYPAERMERVRCLGVNL